MQNTFDNWYGYGEELVHHGIKGQKWGVRNYQNSDGTLTAAGRAHYGIGEGGSRRMARQYNRQMRKLNKLRARADIDTQRANAEKYDKRAAKAMKVGNTAAAVTAALGTGTYGLGGLAKRFDNKVADSEQREIRRKYDAFIKGSDAQGAAHRARALGEITDAQYNRAMREASDAYDNAKNNIHAEEYASRVKNANRRDVTDMIRTGTKYATYAAAGTAAISYGVAAVSKIQSHMAKTRMTEVGHSKAVARVKEQTAKMQKMFVDTPYSALIQNQNKSVVKNKKKVING